MNEQSHTQVSQPLPPPERRRRWLTILLALVIFAAGVVSGGGLAVLFLVNRLQYAIHHPEVAPARIAATLDRRLGLDDEQEQQVEQIIARHQTEIAAIRRQFQPQIMQQLDQVRDEVAAVLTEPQREKWSQLFEQFQSRWLPALPADAKP